MLADISRIASGQFIAQLMLLISLPFITRYYNPEEFGVFAVFSAMTWILVALSTGKVESLIITMKSKNKAIEITIGIFLIVLISSLVVGLIAEFLLLDFLNGFLSKDIEYLSILMGVTVFSIGSSQTLRFYATYLGNFSSHGVAAVLNAIVVISISIGYAVFMDGESLPTGLILGQLLGHFSSFFVFLFYTNIAQVLTIKILRESLIAVLNQIQKIPVLLTTQLAYILSVQIPVLMISIAGGAVGAGAFAMAERIVGMPTSSFGQAVGQVVRHKFSIAYRENSQDVLFPRKVIKSTFIFVVIGYGLLISLADPLIPLLLGDQWRVAISFVQIIAVMELFNFVFYSVVDVAIIRNNFYYRMWSQIAQLMSLIVLYIVIDMKNTLLSVEWVLILICFFRILFVVYDLIRTWQNIGKNINYVK
jgi:O-antigen/teichoic acid export membrane protein